MASEYKGPPNIRIGTQGYPFEQFTELHRCVENLVWWDDFSAITHLSKSALTAWMDNV